MPDLVVIQLLPGVMTDNLELALQQSGRKPWAFNKFLSTMNGIRPGVHVLFVRTTMPTGSPIGRQGAYPPEAVVHRMVLGEVVTSISEMASPFFAGFPHEFWFELIEDREFDPPVDLAGASAFLNDKLPGLGLDDGKLLSVLSNGRSAKVGMYFDGEPRLAAYFKDLSPKSAPGSGGVAPGATPAVIPSGPLADVADEFCGRVEAAGLRFGGINGPLPRAFLAALMAKRFVLLTGLAGSGKTQLARAFGNWLGSDSSGLRHLLVPVRADWTSPEPLLGYEDALLPSNERGDRAWAVPSPLRFMLRAARDGDHPYVLILDEMNLAHVERYFADVLSGIESGEPMLPNLERAAEYWYPVEHGPILLQMPRNLLLIGTVNIDETTYQFSPKVLDRSFSFEFRVSTEELDATLAAIQPVAAGTPGHVSAFHSVASDPDWHLSHEAPAAPDVSALILEIHAQLSPIGLEFGHRSFREALRMTSILSACGVQDYEDLADWVVFSKVLPRVHGSRRQLEPFLRSLQSTAAGPDSEKPELPLVHRKTSRMLESLLTNQYAGFAE